MVHLERQHRRAHQELKEEDWRRKMQKQAMDEVCLCVNRNRCKNALVFMFILVKVYFLRSSVFVK